MHSLGAFNNAIARVALSCTKDDDALDKLQKIYMHKPHPVCQLGPYNRSDIETESWGLPKKAT